MKESICEGIRHNDLWMRMFHSRRKKHMCEVGTIDQLDSAAQIPEEKTPINRINVNAQIC